MKANAGHVATTVVMTGSSADIAQFGLAYRGYESCLASWVSVFAGGRLRRLS